MTDKYAQIIDGYFSNEKNNLNKSFDLSAQKNPTETSELLNFSKENNVSLDIAKKNKDLLRQRSEQKKYDIDGFFQKAPNIANKLQDPNKMAVAKSSLNNLWWFERFGKSIAQGYESGQDTLDLADISFKEFMGQDLTATEQNKKLGIQQRQSQKKDYKLDFFSGIPESVLESLPLMIDPLLSKEAISGALFGGGVGAGIGTMAGGAGAIPGGLTGAGLGYATGRTARIAENETALAFSEFQGFKDENGNPIDKNTARAGAVLSGAISTALETVGLKYVLKAFPHGDKLVSGFTKEGIKKAFKNKAVREQVSRVGTVIQAGLAEGGTEFLQEFSQAIVGEFTKMSADGDFTAFGDNDEGFWGWLADTADRSLEAGFKGAQGGIGMSTAGIAISEGYQKAERLAKAKLEQKQIKKLAEEAEKAELTKTNKDLFLELTDDKEKKVYVGATELKEYFQDKPEQFGFFQENVPEIKEQIEEALETGGDLVLPANKIALALGDADIADITNIMRLTPDALTENDGANVNLQDYLIDDYSDVIDNSSDIRTRIENQLMNAKFTPTTAKAYTDLLTSFYDTQYLRTDKSPEARKKLTEFFDNLIIRQADNEQDAGQRLEDIDLLIERAKIIKRKRGKFRANPMQEYLRRGGGILKDTPFAKDLESLGVKKTSGLFKAKDGIKHDAIPINEFEDALQVQGIPDDGQGYVDPEFIAEVISEELAGNDWRENYKGDTPNKQAIDFLNQVETAGLDIENINRDSLKPKEDINDFVGNLSKKSVKITSKDKDFEVLDKKILKDKKISEDEKEDFLSEEYVKKIQQGLRDSSRVLMYDDLSVAMPHEILNIDYTNSSEVLKFKNQAKKGDKDAEKKLKEIKKLPRKQDPKYLDKDKVNSFNNKKLIFHYASILKAEEVYSKNNLDMPWYISDTFENIKSEFEYRGIDPNDIILDGDTVTYDPSAKNKGRELFQNDFDPQDGTVYDGDTITIDGVERSTVNSNGQKIAQTKEGLENFWRWFGESKVVDENGKPLVVYHGTNADFEAFDSSFQSQYNQYGNGFFFTENKEIADNYGDITLPVYLKAEIGIIDKRNKKRKGVQVEIDHIRPKNDTRDIWVVFNPTQIKSTSNRGTFDPNDARILYQKDYQMDHLAPAKEDGNSSLDDVSFSFGENIYSSNAINLYKQGDYKENKESIDAINKYKNKPNAKVTVYRAIPLNVEAEIMPGDWITLSKEYANIHGRSSLKGKYKLLTKKIPASEIYTDGNSIHEWGWDDGSVVREVKKYEKKIIDKKEKTKKIKERKNFLSQTIQEYRASFIEKNKSFENFINEKNLAENKDFIKLLQDYYNKASSFAKKIALDKEGKVKSETIKNIAKYFETNIEKIPEDFYLQEKQSIKRGSYIKTKDNLNIISLFKDRDLSTVLHESGHFFLETFKAMAEAGDAPEQIMQDWKELSSWLEIKDGTISVDSHEGFARGFEAYIMEGKAPSEGLARAFDLFKSFMKRIYQSIKNLNVSLNDEVRNVFDRMLATDIAIEGLKGKHIFKPDPEILKMLTKAEQDDYIKRNEKQIQDAKNKLLSENLKKEIKKEKAVLKEERESLTKEATNRIMQSPIHKLRYFLNKGKMYNADELLIGIDKLDRNIIKNEYGEEIIELLPSKFFKKNGADPEIMADLFGFNDVSQMFDNLINSPQAKDEINRSVKEDIDRRYGNALNDGTIERDALDSTYNDLREKNLEYEFDVIKRKSFDIAVTKIDLKKRAEEIANEKTVDEIIKPDQYYRAEVRAAGESQKHLAKKEYEKAAQAKARQLLNHYLYKEAQNARNYTDKTLKRFNKYKKRPAVGKVVIDEDYRKKAVQLINEYDFTTRKKQGKIIPQLDLWMKSKEESDSAQFLEIDENLKNQAGTHFRDLSFGNFVALVENVENIIAQGRLNRTLEIEGEKHELNKIASVLSEQIENNLKDLPEQPLELRTTEENRKRNAKNYFNVLIKGRTILRELDSFKENGLFYQYILRPLNIANERLVKRQQSVAKQLNDIFDAHYKGRLIGEINKQYDVAGVGKIRKQAMLAYALNWGAVENRQRLLSNENMSEGQINNILSELTKNDWEFVEKIWNLLESFKNEIWALEKRRSGIEPLAVKTVPFEITTKDGATLKLNGGYYPIKYEFLKENRTQEENIDELQKNIGARAQTNRGHTKARVQRVNKPIRNDLGVLFSHISAVLLDLEMGEVLSNSHRIISKQNIANAIISKKGKSYYQQIDLWLKDMAIGGQLASEGFAKYMDGLRAGVSVATMGFKVSTVLIQLTGLTQTAAVIGSKNMLNGVRLALGNGSPNSIKKSFQFAFDNSKILTQRSETFNRDIFDALRRMDSEVPWKKKLTELAFYPMIKMQSLVDVFTWHGAYQKGLNDFKGNEKRAFEYADDIIRRAQGSGLFKDLSAFERGTISEGTRLSGFVRLFTVYMNYFNTKLNIAYEKTKQTDFKNPENILNYAVDFLLLFTLEAALGSFLLGQAPTDEEDGVFNVFSWLAKGTLDTTVAQFPGVREMYGVMQGFKGAPAGLKGFEAIGEVGVSIKKSFENIFTEDDINLNKLLRDVNMAGGIVFKYPASQINQMLRAMDKKSQGKDVSPIEYLLYRGNK
jgi:hypothetical protein